MAGGLCATPSWWGRAILENQGRLALYQLSGRKHAIQQAAVAGQILHVLEQAVI